MSQQQLTAKDEGEKFADLFSVFANRSSHEERHSAAIAKMLTDHRTNQQNMMRFFVKFLEAMSKKSRFDGRDEASVKLAQEIFDKIESKMLVLPYI